MMEQFEQVLPGEIEKRSMEIIRAELGNVNLNPLEEPIIKRCIHTSADFDYVDTLTFSEGAVSIALEALKNGVSVVTDTNMGKSGVNKRKLESLGGRCYCFMADEDVAEAARNHGTTRAVASMEKAASMKEPLIIAVGNAPTALVRLYELIQEGSIKPALIIGVPVGFVNVVQAKELIMTAGVPYIVARGRKGGSNIAAAIVNALLYMITGNE